MTLELVRSCTATNSQGERCGMAPIRGGSVCYRHGGNAPQTQAKAAERLAAARDHALELFVQRMDDNGDLIDPNVLLKAIGELTKLSELLDGRATQRSEEFSVQRAETVTLELQGKIERLASRAETLQEARGRVPATVDDE